MAMLPMAWCRCVHTMASSASTSTAHASAATSAALLLRTVDAVAALAGKAELLRSSTLPSSRDTSMKPSVSPMLDVIRARTPGVRSRCRDEDKRGDQGRTG
jgi:hypothetical protein